MAGHAERAQEAGQRVGRPAAPAQREHQLGVKAFPQRIPGHQCLQLGDKVSVPAQVQVGIDPPLLRLQP